MLSPYKAAVEMAVAILLSYRDVHGEHPFPTIKGKLMPLIEARAGLNGVDNIYIKRFKEKMLPIAGQLRRITEANGAYSPVENHGIIYLCPSLDLDWARFIQIKEASHLMLDKPEDFVHSSTDIEQLLLCLAQFGREQTTKQYVSEMRAQVCAFELLFPKAARDQLQPRYAEGIISASDIARAARIPTEVIRIVMRDEYRKMIDPLYLEVEAERAAPRIRVVGRTRTQ
jgi:Zn-dependent peptidase ImmA (M78 family)